MSTIKEFTYSYGELAIEVNEISRLLGYPHGILPDPFSEYVAEAISLAEGLCQIRGAVYFSDEVRFPETKDRILIANTEFAIGKKIGKELLHSESVALFICTAGKKISELSGQLLMGEHPVLGYVYDVLGSIIADSAAEKIHQEIKKLVAIDDLLVTNRYSPGYCQWKVDDQHPLFSLFPEKCCGISLTDSALMHPVKSVSGIIGIGKDVKYRQYTCDLCSLTDCFYRNRPKEK